MRLSDLEQALHILTSYDKISVERMLSTMKKNKKIIVMGSLLAALLLIFTFIHTYTRPTGDNEKKTIYVTVLYPEAAGDRFTITTEEEFLRGALEQIGLIEGTESEYGLFVQTVNGVTADEARHEWWCFTEQGEELYTGVDASPITDGAEYEITLKTW